MTRAHAPRQVLVSLLPPPYYAEIDAAQAHAPVRTRVAAGRLTQVSYVTS